MKRLLSTITALLIGAFVLSIAPVMAGDMIPEKSTNRYFGQALTTGTGATFDSVNWGFTSRYVRLCLRVDSNLTYIRFGTTTTTSADEVEASAIGNRMTVAVNTPSIFINGDATQTQDALPMTAQASDDTVDLGPHCTTQPWATQGLVIHSAGNATLDVWAF